MPRLERGLPHIASAVAMVAILPAGMYLYMVSTVI